MDWLKRLGFVKGNEKEEEPISVVKPLLTLSSVDFDYMIKSNKFRRFNYVFDVNLYGDADCRINQSREGIEKIVGFFDMLYTPEKGFKRVQDGNISSNLKKIEIVYRNDKLLYGETVGVHFNARFKNNAIIGSYALLFLQGIDHENLLSTHDSILGWDNMQISPHVAESLAQIDKIRKGTELTVQNFLLA